MRFRPTIIVVAAGRSSRYGAVASASAASSASLPAPATASKLAQPFGPSTVLGSTLRNAVQSQLPVLVVTSAALQALAMGQVARRDVLVLSDDDAARGMGHTIAAGVAERSGAPGWLVLPGDMPLVQPGTLLAVARALEQHPVAYAQHKGRRGHPVGFAAELYSELVLLSGDEGARRIVARYPAYGEEVADAGVLVDIDTPAELDAARAMLAGPAAGAASSAPSAPSALSAPAAPGASADTVPSSG